ncbi:hypothetical protein [Desulfobacter hydrogenophilus]
MLRKFFKQSSNNCEKCDLNNDGMITVRDAIKLIRMCTCSKCNCD